MLPSFLDSRESGFIHWQLRKGLKSAMPSAATFATPIATREERRPTR